MFVDCIHVVFCRPIGLVAGFNAICNACLCLPIESINFFSPEILLKSKVQSYNMHY